MQKYVEFSEGLSRIEHMEQRIFFKDSNSPEHGVQWLFPGRMSALLLFLLGLLRRSTFAAGHPFHLKDVFVELLLDIFCH